MVLADSPLACIRRTSAALDLSSALDRLMRWPRAGRTWVSWGRVPSMCNVSACLMWHSAGVSAAAAAAPSGVVTFLFTDIEGSTRRWEADAQAMRAALSVHDKLLRTAIESYDGFLFSHTGDGFVAAFASPTSAVNAAIERLAAAPADEGLVIREIWLLRLRALLARAHRDDARYRDFRDRYRDMARTLGFEGHIAWAEEMP